MARYTSNRFKDIVNGGTLFNYGNPIREMDPHGIRLETLIIEKNELKVLQKILVMELRYFFYQLNHLKF